MLDNLYLDTDLISAAPSKSKDLLSSNPALFFLLSNNKNIRLEKKVKMLSFKQKTLALFFGFKEESQAVNILRKLNIDAVSETNLDVLRKSFLNKKALKLLNHIEFINETVIKLLTNDDILQSFTPSLFFETAKNSEITYQHIEQALKAYNAVLGEIPQLNRIDDIISFPKKLIKKVNRNSQIPFSASPYPDVPGIIEQVKTPKEYIELSFRQKNCARKESIFWDMIVSGKAWFFKVFFKEEEATALVLKDPFFIEALGESNSPTPIAKLLIFLWFIEGGHLSHNITVGGNTQITFLGLTKELRSYNIPKLYPDINGVVEQVKTIEEFLYLFRYQYLNSRLPYEVLLNIIKHKKIYVVRFRIPQDVMVIIKSVKNHNYQIISWGLIIPELQKAIEFWIDKKGVFSSYEWVNQKHEDQQLVLFDEQNKKMFV